jgi:DNA-binding NarL/FixJ family response regulator
MPGAYRILLADDHAMFRELIGKCLGDSPGIEIVGEAGDGEELLKSIETMRPHLIVLDIEMPRLSGLDAARKIKQTHPGIKILLLTMHKSTDYLTHALDTGIDGYLIKENVFQDLLTAIDTIRQGRTYLSSLVTQQVLDAFSKKSRTRLQDSEPLSGRELEILKYLAEGKSNKEIAGLLLISDSTVRIHLGNIKKKLFLKTNAELTRYAIKKGHVSLP